MLFGGYHTVLRGAENSTGKRILIDAAEVGGKYEIMVMYTADGTEIESAYTKDAQEACKIHNDLVAKYKVEEKLTGKYQKLFEDVLAAMSEAERVATENPEDGGTCNFDSPAVYLPKFNKKIVEKVFEKAGTFSFEWKLFGKKMFVFGTRTGGQGNRRTRAAEAAYEVMKDRGYDATVYYQMD